MKQINFLTVLFLLTIFVASCNKNEDTSPETTPITSDGNFLNPNLTYDSITDQEGNTYATIVIDTQEWMAENLRTTTYANGDPIPNVTSNNEWENLTSGAWVHYNNNNQYEEPYGKLYNWYAVSDQRNVCPNGWHVATDGDWNTLINFLDSNAFGGDITPNLSGGKMKSSGTQYWQSPNAEATNESGFSAIPGGSRGSVGNFNSLGYTGIWWTSTEANSLYVYYRFMKHDNGSISKFSDVKGFGHSVRCVRD
jgi:uncharacterized protein (TIGR02145 family)